MKSKQYPSQNEIREWFEYRDGRLYWKVNKSKKTKIGQQAGSATDRGYRQIRINSKQYKEHRIIWIYFNGDIPDGMQIDHINMIRNDNRIENLRVVFQSINRLNTNSKNITKYNRTNGEITYIGRYAINGKEFSKSFHTEQEATDWVAKKKSEIFENSGARGLKCPIYMIE